MFSANHILPVLLICAASSTAQVSEHTAELKFDRTKATIETRFDPPAAFRWIKEEPGSFADFLIAFPLHPPGFPVRDHTGLPISRQNHHAALLNIDVGAKDLQQCADAWIRLYAEYLWANKRFADIGFEFTDGTYFSWKDFSEGWRTKQRGKKVTLVETGKTDNSYAAFRKYLETIFVYAGTISIDRESRPVTSNDEIRPGDFLVKPGSPGHLVFIVGSAKNGSGKKLYLLAEGFMPAQDIHILVNHENPKISPWYELDIDAAETKTAKYTFVPTVIKRFHALR